MRLYITICFWNATRSKLFWLKSLTIECLRTALRHLVDLCLMLITWLENSLIDWLLFYVPPKNISLMRIYHNFGWRTAKCRATLGARGFRAWRNLHRTTSAVTQDLIFFRSDPNDRLIQSPLTTHKWVWVNYSNLDRYRSTIGRLLRHTK
jgi:hypothetical protein